VKKIIQGFNSDKGKSLLFAGGLIAIMGLGVWVRAQVFQEVVRHQQSELREKAPGAPPFSRESAIQFRQLREYYGTGTLPERDPDIQWPGGVDIARTYSLGSERVYAVLMRWMPGDWTIVRRARAASVFWFCLGIPLLGIAAWKMFSSRLAGGIAALIYSVSAASVVRSSGLELSTENFALPIVCAFLAFDAWAASSRRRSHRWVFSLLSAAALAFAMIGWDLVQALVLCWAGRAYVRLLRGPRPEDPDFFPRFLLQGVALLLAGLLNPYLLAHAFPRSPVLLFALAVALLGCLAARAPGRALPRWVRVFAPWVVFAGALILSRGLGDAYGHFGELLSAKLRFLNWKPWEPGLLTFNQRVLWTPALHSMTWDLLRDYFPLLFLLTPAALAVYLSTRISGDPRSPLFPAVFLVLSFAACILFFRFHVYVILFASLVAGGALAVSLRRGLALVWIPLAVALVLGISGEALNTLRKAGTRWAGETPFQVRASAELIDWLRTNARRQPVVANFTISGPIVAHAGNPVVLHPKYEDRLIRDRVEKYARLLFRGTEVEFRDWCDSVGARLVVFVLGEFAPDTVQVTPRGMTLVKGPRTPAIKTWMTGELRYMADALEPVEGSPALFFLKRAMEEHLARTHLGYRRHLPIHEQPRLFRFLWSNEKYAVFRVISAREQELAELSAEMAGISVLSGDLAAARTQVLAALDYDPNLTKAYALLAHIEQLRAGNRPPGRE
jgi:hypothetical protein